MARYKTSGTKTSIGAINTELEKVAVSQEDFLSRVGEAPNQMEAPLDMNSNQLLNLPYPADPTSPIRLLDLDRGSLVEPVIPPTYFNIKDYGAREESTGAENKVAIDLAITALSESGGGCLWIPRGTFLTTGSHDIVDSMHIKGEGMFISKLKIPTGNASDTIFTKPDPETVITNLIISDIKLEGSWDTALREGTGSLVSGRNIVNVIIRSVYFLHARFFSLNLNLCPNVSVTDCRFLYGCRDMCGVWNGSNVIIANNFFKGNDDDCISLNSDSFEPIDNIVKTKIIITGNTLEDTGGIKIQNPNTATISNNILQRNKGNAQINIQAGGAGGLHEANPQSIIVQNNLITDIMDRFLSTEVSPTVNARLGIKITTREGTVANEVTDPYNFFYTDTGAADADAIRVASGIVVKDNVIRRTLPAVANYSDWGFGRMFTRFSTDTFAPDGFVDPEILETYLSVRPVEIEGPLKNSTFRDNYFEHSCLEVVDFQAAEGGTIADGYYSGLRFLNNVFKNCSTKAIDLAPATGTTQDILFKGNLFDLDPLLVATNRQADGSWSSASNSVAIYVSDVSGIKIIDNVFMNLASPYIQGSVTEFIVKFNNTFVGEPVAGATAGAFNSGSKGVGLYPEEIKSPTSILIYQDSDPLSGTYGTMFDQPVRRVSGGTPPSSGFYFAGEFLPSDDGVEGGGLVTLGHRRLTSGTGSIVNTDWKELRASV
jgi:hypothetical protein